MEGSSLTAIRTGAGGGVAADLLARKAAKTVGLFGAGVQARAQLQAVMAVREIARGESHEPHNSLSPTTRHRDRSVDRCPGSQSRIESATGRRGRRHRYLCDDIGNPHFLMGTLCRPGTHITAVGTFVPEKREVDTTTIRRAARIVVDSRDACLEEAGDLIIPNADIDAGNWRNRQR